MRASIALFGLAVACASAGGFPWTLTSTAQDTDVRLRPDDAAVVAAGERTYVAQCAVCHGPNLEGQDDWRRPGPDGKLPAPPHDETGHTWHHDDATLFRLTKHGLAQMLGPDSKYQSNMPAYEGVLSDGDIIAVLSFIKSRWPVDVRARHDALNERAKR